MMSLLEALNLGILTFDSISASNLLKLFTYTEVGKKTLWNILLDNQDFLLANQDSIPADLQSAETTSTNPFYFNNFLINSPFPYLSSCVTKQFWTGLYKLHDFQKEAGYYLDCTINYESTAQIISHPEKWTIDDTFSTHIKMFFDTMVTIDVKDVLINYLKQGKLKEIPPQLTIGLEDVVRVKKKVDFLRDEYGILGRTMHFGLSIFKQKKTHRSKQDTKFIQDTSKNEVIYDKPSLSADELIWLRENGYTNKSIKEMDMPQIKKLLFRSRLEKLLAQEYNDEQAIINFVLDYNTRGQFTSIQQIHQVAEKSDIAAIILIKDDRIRQLFIKKDDIVRFIGQYPATETYFRQDPQIKSLLSDNLSLSQLSG